MTGEGRRNDSVVRNVFGQPKLSQTKIFRTNQ
jgi:hypothetical protein